MKVKIGDKWYDSLKEPICIQISEKEQTQIGNMDRTVAAKGKYASFPDDINMTIDEMYQWMKNDDE